jgi:aminotransferase
VQDAAAEALTASQDCVAEMQREYARRRARVSEVLAGVDGIRVLAPEGGFFTMVDTKGLGEPSDVTRRRLLEKHSVVVIHGAAYGAAGEGTLRVAFSSGATLEEGLSRLRRGLADRAA